MCNDELSFFEKVSKIRAAIGVFTIIFLLFLGISIKFTEFSTALFVVFVSVSVILAVRSAICFYNMRIIPDNKY